MLVSLSKNIYVSDKNANQFLPLFGKTPGSFHFKKLDTSVYLSKDYVLAMDPVKNIYRYEVSSKQGSSQKMYEDKRIAMEIYQNSTFIELYPTDKDIWALNSMR